MLFVTLARICLSEQLEKSLETYPGVILLVSITYSTYPLLYLTGVLLILSHFPPLCSSLTLSSLCFPLSHSHTHSLSLTPSLPSLSLSIPSLPLYHLSQQEELVERALGVDWQRCMKMMATHTTLRTQTTTLRKRWEWSTFRTFLWLLPTTFALFQDTYIVSPSTPRMTIPDFQRQAEALFKVFMSTCKGSFIASITNVLCNTHVHIYNLLMRNAVTSICSCGVVIPYSGKFSGGGGC